MSKKQPSQDPKEYWHRRADRIDEILESWRAAASFAGLAIRSAILLNGAAAVAMLAFIAALGDQLPPTVLETAKAKVLQLGGGLLRRGIPRLVQLGTSGAAGAAFSFAQVRFRPSWPND